MEKYGQPTPPKINVESINDVPIAMFSAKYDRIVQIETNREYASVIPAVIQHFEIEADHISFLVGKDMGYLENVKDILSKYSPLGEFSLKSEFVNLK